ncbi:hypothetical protein Tco_1297568 [Tanacetum coccineum]
MSEDDEEKTGFHMKERVYYFTHMPNGLKNSRATLQRTMETVLAEQREKNVEVQLEEAVIKSKLEQDLIEDVEETLYKLQRVNMKLNSSGCVFRIEEGKFLCYVETTKGIKANPEKLVELIFPFYNIRKSIGTEEAFNWTSEADKSFQEI